MSKFRTRLRNLGRPGGIGFGVQARQPQSRHVLVLSEASDAAQAAEAVAAGVDGVVLRGSAAALEGLELKTTLAGVWLEEADGARVIAARDAGADFFLFDDGRAHASALVPTDIGRVLLLGDDREADRLRSIAALDLDAVLVAAEVGAITVRDQLSLRRIAGLVGAPLLVATSTMPDAAQLEAWRDAGAPAVLVPAGAGDLHALVAAAAAVPPRRREEGGTPSIAGLGAHASGGHEHDDDDDDF